MTHLEIAQCRCIIDLLTFYLFTLTLHRSDCRREMCLCARAIIFELVINLSARYLYCIYDLQSVYCCTQEALPTDIRPRIRRERFEIRASLNGTRRRFCVWVYIKTIKKRTKMAKMTKISNCHFVVSELGSQAER